MQTPHEGESGNARGDKPLAKSDSYDGSLEFLLSKYISVWIWSIAFGTVSTVAFSFLNVRISDKGGIFAMAGLLPAAIGTLFILAAFVNLYRCLVSYLIPQFILHRQPDPMFFAGCVRAAFVEAIIAFGFRFLMSLLEAALSALSRTG